MISSADTEPLDILPIFSSLGVRVTFLVPTKTAMQKSIIDATIPVQEYFIETGLHDYQNQNQGNDNKVQIGKPFLTNSKISAKIIQQVKGPKITVLKTKPKKRYTRKKGHRQSYTRVQIDGL